MKKPIQIALVATAVGTAVVVMLALIFRQFGDGDEPMGAGAAVGVFVGVLFASTNAAYAQGRKDAAAEIGNKESSS